MKLYLIGEVAREINCTYRTMQRYIADKRIKAVKIGNKWQITEDELKFIKENGLRPKQNILKGE
mgnify:CR=1 FL=1